MRTITCTCLILSCLTATAQDDQTARRLADLEKRIDTLEKENRRILTILIETRDRADAVAAKRDSLPRDDRRRVWHFADGSTLLATLADFHRGKAILVDDTGEQVEIAPEEFEPDDREIMQAEIRRRAEIERQQKAGDWVNCPNPRCKRGVLYLPATGTGVIANAGRVGTLTLSGLRPAGPCPTCHGKGVVPNPAKHPSRRRDP